ncbi:antitoxin Xre/MbcA/ParS toxin-binding domain-containing protein [Pseudomonas sp. zjy_8]|uniref:antitoxin Xre/MbcA/ParS toxin-binding domain-containing protein n=1 Tax=Pseudomonas sp. GLN_2 TaxID=3367180 RepID=UPI00370A6A47
MQNQTFTGELRLIPNELTQCISRPTGCWSTSHHCFLARFDSVLGQARQVLGSAALADSWMIKPAFGLRYVSPCSLLNDQPGLSVVTDLLLRIEYGVYT